MAASAAIPEGFKTRRLYRDYSQMFGSYQKSRAAAQTIIAEAVWPNIDTQMVVEGFLDEFEPDGLSWPKAR